MTATLFASLSHAEDDYYPPLITLISQMANMSVMADRCEQKLLPFGKAALESEECASYKKSFYEQWPSREALQLEILDIVNKIEQGELSCDERCNNMLLRSEELRISVTYILDYMDFLAE